MGSLVDQGLVSLSSFVTIFLFARDLDPEHFGLVALVLTGAQMIMALQGAMVGEVHNVLVPVRPERARATLTGSLVVMLMGLAGVFAVVGILVGALLALFAPASEWSTLPLALVAMAVPWMVQDGARRMLYTERRMPLIFATDLVAYGLMAFGAVAMTVGWLPMTFSSAVLVVFLSTGIGAVVALVSLWVSGARIVLGEVGPDARETWSMARYLLGGEAVRALQGNVTTWIVAGVAGLPAMGAYRAAVQLVNALNPLQQAVSLWWPSLSASYWARHGGAAYRRWYTDRAVRLVLGFAALAGLIAGASEPLLELAYGARYAAFPMTTLVIVSALGRVFVVARNVAHIGLVSGHLPKIVAVDSMLEAVLLAIVGIPLILWNGTVGAAVFHAMAPLVLGLYACAWFTKLDGPRPVTGLRLAAVKS